MPFVSDIGSVENKWHSLKKATPITEIGAALYRNAMLISRLPEVLPSGTVSKLKYFRYRKLSSPLQQLVGMVTGTSIMSIIRQQSPPASAVLAGLSCGGYEEQLTFVMAFVY